MLFLSGLSAQRADAVAPFPINDPTNGTPGAIDPNWTRILTNNTVGNTYTSDGWLRLNNNGGGEATNLFNPTAFPSSTGFQIQFDYRQAGGTPLGSNTGDGISFYLFDGSVGTYKAGGAGAGLAYANTDAGGGTCGITKGYFGLGLDVYGNYATGNKGNYSGIGGAGGTTQLTNGLDLRGSGPGDCVTGGTTAQYPWVAGTQNPGGSPVWTGINADTRDPATYASSYRSVRVVVVPSGGNVQVTVYMTPPQIKTAPMGTFSQVFSSNLSSVAGGGQAALPGMLKLGFGASSGGATDYKDVRNVSVVALSDLSVTKTLSASTPGTQGPGQFVAGDTVSFMIVATNNGPTAIGTAPSGVARVYDNLGNLPLSGVTWTCTAAGGAVCLTGNGSGSVVSENWTAPSGGSITLTVSGTISATAAATTYVNTAVIPTNFTANTVDPTSNLVQLDGGLADTDLANNTASATFLVVPTTVPAPCSAIWGVVPGSTTTTPPGNVLVTIDPVTGIVTTYPKLGPVALSSGSGGNVSSLAIDPRSGRMFAIDNFSGNLETLAPGSTTWADTGITLPAGTGANQYARAAMDGGGNLYVGANSNTSNTTIYRYAVTPAGTVAGPTMVTIAYSGGASSGSGGDFAISPNGTLYIFLDTGAGQPMNIYSVSSSVATGTSATATFVGTATGTNAGDVGGTAFFNGNFYWTSTSTTSEVLQGSSASGPYTVLNATNVPAIGDLATCVGAATVQLAKISNAGSGAFAYTGVTNLTDASGTAITSDAITTTSAGTQTASSRIGTVTTLGTAVGAAETVPPGWQLAANATCTDTGSSVSGNPASFTVPLSGSTLTIPAANVKAGARLTCTFTNTATANVAITKTDLSSSYSPGGSATYAIAVTNSTPAVATVNGATVSDLLPAGLTIAAPGIACTGSGGAACAGSGSPVGTAGTGALNILAGLSLTLPPGGRITITVPVTFGSTPSGY